MSKKDEANEAAELVGGWENLARGLYELQPPGKNIFLTAPFCKYLFDPIKPTRRGAKTKRDPEWFFMIERILARHTGESECSVIGDNLGCFSGKKISSNTESREKAIKTIQNQLAQNRKMVKRLQAKWAEMEIQSNLNEDVVYPEDDK